jgi:Zn-dependent protease with chaperone function
MYELLGICLALSALLALNALMSLVVGTSWRLFAPALRNLSAGLRAELLFTLRISAPAIAIIAVAAVFVPAFITHEPYATGEVVSKKLAALAILSAAGVALALARAIRSWFATRSLLRDWLVSAKPIQVAGVTKPTYSLPHSFPIIAVVGTFRPRLFIAERVLKSLTEDELAASIAHECGHLNARDNLKRSVLRICRDVLMLVPCGRSVDRAWAEAAECAADEHAAQGSPRIALNLASALVKIAKMIPLKSQAAMPLAVFLVGVEEGRGIKARVSRLLDLASRDYGRGYGDSTVVKILPAIALAALVTLGIAVASHPSALVNVHTMIEQVVQLLS